MCTKFTATGKGCGAHCTGDGEGEVSPLDVLQDVLPQLLAVAAVQAAPVLIPAIVAVHYHFGVHQQIEVFEK